MQIRKTIQIHFKNLQQLSFVFLTSSSFPDSCRKATKNAVLFSNQDKRISTELAGFSEITQSTSNLSSWKKWDFLNVKGPIQRLARETWCIAKAR